MKELSKRLSVAAFGIPVLIGFTYLGDWYFFGLITVISLVAQWEFYHIQRVKGYQPQRITGVVAGFLILLSVETESWILSAMLTILSVMFVSAAEMFRKHNNASVNTGITLLGIFYIPVFLAALLITRDFINSVYPLVPEAGFWFIIIHFAAIWTCDTFAYGFGTWLGRHTLYKKVSPNKSFEGFIAGIAGALLIYIVVMFLQLLPFDWLAAMSFGLIVGVFGQGGDLVESWFKRDAGVKDTSALLPGHGGMLDRFDSIIFTAPLMLIVSWVLYR